MNEEVLTVEDTPKSKEVLEDEELIDSMYEQPTEAEEAKIEFSKFCSKKKLQKKINY